MRMLLLLVMMFVCITGFKQDKSRRISGMVYGADDHQPLPGATVRIKGGPRGTLTDRGGHYMIDVPESATQLVFEYIGYNKQIVTIGKKDTIYLMPISVQLDDKDLFMYDGIRKTINKKDTVKK
jgi:hypothetical protein